MLHRGIVFDDGDGVADLHAAVEDASDRDAADVVAGVEIGDQSCSGASCRRGRRHELTTASNSGRRSSPATSDPSSPCRCAILQHRKVELLGGVEVDEQVVDLPSTSEMRRPVNLLITMSGVSRRSSFPKNKAGLRQRFLPTRPPAASRHPPSTASARLRRRNRRGREADDVDQDVVVVDAVFARIVMSRCAPLAAVHRLLGHLFVRAEGAAQGRGRPRGLPWSTCAMIGRRVKRVGDVRFT